MLKKVMLKIMPKEITKILFGQMLLSLCAALYALKSLCCVLFVMEICINGSVLICCLPDRCMRARVARKGLEYLHVKDPLTGQIISKLFLE